MHFRALPLLIILLGTAAAQTTTMQHSQLPLSATDANATTFGSVTGTVTTLDDRTLRDAHVELRNIMTGAMLISTTAAPDGSFQIYNIPPGTYEVSTTTEVKRSLSLTLDKGQTRYVRFNIAIGFFVGHVYPELVENEVGEKEIAGCKYIGGK